MNLNISFVLSAYSLSHFYERRDLAAMMRDLNVVISATNFSYNYKLLSFNVDSCRCNILYAFIFVVALLEIVFVLVP